MNNIKEEILSTLSKLQGSDKFATSGSLDFIFPGLVVKKTGELSYPVNEFQAKALIGVARKALFGKGTETVFDDTVRKGWEIDADNLSFEGKQWDDFIGKVLKKIKPDLGLENYTISARLYKMLIYEEGDFFLPHKDTEKEKGMFGTLIVGLPAKHTGGELIISFEGKHETVSLNSHHTLDYAAFYADCDHEVRPVTSGYRICLVYNLIQENTTHKISPTSLTSSAEHISKLLKEHSTPQPLIVLLGHQYTPANFSREMLKLNDRTKASALLQAAEIAGYYAKLCLVTSYKMGSPAYSSSYWDDEKIDDSVIDELLDESLEIEHWAHSTIPALSKLSFDEQDLITPHAIGKGKPIEKESTGYMGNYGPDLEHWYHYGAVVLWSKGTNTQLLESQNTATQLEWIDYFTRNGISDIEKNAVYSSIASGLNYPYGDDNAGYNTIIDWIIYENNPQLLMRLDLPILKHYFRKVHATYWVKLFAFSGENTSREIVGRITGALDLPTLQSLLSVFRAMHEEKIFINRVSEEVFNFPEYFSLIKVQPDRQHYPANIPVLQDTLWFDLTYPQTEDRIHKMAAALTRGVNPEYVKQILLPPVMDFNGSSPLAICLLVYCKNYLQDRVNNKPQPPENWSRAVPKSPGYAHQWSILKAFLESPNQQFFDFRRKQDERTEMEHAINSVTIDLKTETIRQGSPHLLRITKTKYAYNQQMKTWKEEVGLLNEVLNKLPK